MYLSLDATVVVVDIVHRDDKASPQNQKVRTEVGSEKVSSFEVWCLRAI